MNDLAGQSLLPFATMAILAAANIELSFGTRRILDGASITLEAGEHVGLVGRNGTGKSTLLKLMAGLPGLQADKGQIQLARNATVGYLTQDPKLNLELTLLEEAKRAFAHVEELQTKLEKLAHDMAEAEGDALDRLMREYEQVEHQIEAAGGLTTAHRVEAVLHGVGITDNLFDVKVADLSGGQKGRLSLAKLLLSEPDVLLLDEPTNHLDIAGREWLEEYLSESPSAVILISHDRWLLDRVVTCIYELEEGRILDYPGNYQKYVELRAERQLVRQREYEKQQVKIRQEKAFIDRYRAGQRAKQAAGRERKLERLIANEGIDRPSEHGVMNLQLPKAKRCSENLISCLGLTKNYDTKLLFTDFDFSMKRGDRVGIIGPNGAGKSTLVACLLETLASDKGQVRLGTGVDVGYFRQTHEDMNLELTVIEYIKFSTELGEQEARDLAGAFLFSGIDQEKQLGMLSGGERSRARIATLVAGGHNLLVLDEPTNHLDIPSAERLEGALKQFCQVDERRRDAPGSLILITHDRMLLDDLVDQLIILDGDGGIRHMYGKYSDYLADREKLEKHNASIEAATTAKTEQPVQTKPAKEKATQPAAIEPQPEAKPKATPAKGERRGAHTKYSDAKLEGRIADLEKEIGRLDKKLADPNTYREVSTADMEKMMTQRDGLASELELLEEEWLFRAE